MIDIDLTYRDAFGHVTFGFKANGYNSGIEIVLQKVTTLLLSSTKQTYFGLIVGGDIINVGMYNFSSMGNDDFKVNLGNAVLNIKKTIQQSDVTNNIPYADRLKNIIIKDILYDKKTLGVVVSLLVSTNSSNTLVNLPVKQ